MVLKEVFRHSDFALEVDTDCQKNEVDSNQYNKNGEKSKHTGAFQIVVELH